MSNLHYATLAIHLCDGPLRNKVFTDFRFKRWTFRESEFYLTRLKGLSEKKKAVLTMVYTLMLLHVLLGLNVRQINLVWDTYKELTEGKVDVVCMYKN